MRKRILNARVSEELYDEIAKKAKQHRVTVSNLVRDLIQDSIYFYRSYIGEKVADQIKKGIGVVGYQAFEVATPMKCALCKAKLVKGDSAYFVLLDSYWTKKAVICEECKRNNKRTTKVKSSKPVKNKKAKVKIAK